MQAIESTDAWTWTDLSQLLRERRNEASYHLFSESQLRGEIFNLERGDNIAPRSLDGHLLITGLTGNVSVTANEAIRQIAPLCQILLCPGTRFSVVAETDASIQFLWSPPFPAVHPE